MSAPMDDMFGPPPDEAETEKLAELDLKSKFDRYWEQYDGWDQERLYRTSAVCGKMLYELAISPAEPSAPRVGALKAAADVFLKLLNKHMPDVRAVELRGSLGVSHEEALAALELGVAAAEKAGDGSADLRLDVPSHTH